MWLHILAAVAEERKKAKSIGSDCSHIFTPVAIETLGVIALSKTWIKQRSGEDKALTCLLHVIVEKA